MQDWAWNIEMLPFMLVFKSVSVTYVQATWNTHSVPLFLPHPCCLNDCLNHRWVSVGKVPDNSTHAVRLFSNFTNLTVRHACNEVTGLLCACHLESQVVQRIVGTSSGLSHLSRPNVDASGIVLFAWHNWPEQKANSTVPFLVFMVREELDLNHTITLLSHAIVKLP